MGTFNAGAIEASLTLDRSSWTRDYRTTLREVQRLEDYDITIGVDADTTNAEIALDNLERNMDTLENDPVSIGADADFSRINAQLDHLEQVLDHLDNRIVTVMADADTTNALIQLDNLEHNMDSLERDPINIEADADVADAMLQLEGLREMANLLDGKDIDIDVDVNRGAIERFSDSVTGLVGSNGHGGSMGFWRIAILGIIALSPLLAAAIEGALAYAVALGGALVGAGGSAAVLAVGLTGLVKRFNEAKEAGDPLNENMQLLDDALGRLSGAWEGFLDKIEKPGFELMAQGVDLLADVLPTLTPVFEAAADAVSGLLDGIDKFVKSPEYQEMIDFFTDFGGDALGSLGRSIGNLILFFGRLFDAFEPLSRDMLKGLEDMTAGWAEWADGLKKNPAFQDFMQDVQTYGPMIIDFFVALINAFRNISEALQPITAPMFAGLTTFLNWIGDMDSDQLTLIIGLIGGLWGAFKLGPGAISMLTGALGLITGPIGLILVIVGGLIFAIMQLWQENEKFRDIVIAAWEMVKETFGTIINSIKTWIEENQDKIQKWAGIWEDVKETIMAVIEAILAIVTQVLEEIKFAWDKWGGDILKFTGRTFDMIFDVIKGVLQFVKGIFQVITGAVTGDWSKMREGLVNIAQGLWNTLRGIFNGIWDFIRAVWGRIRDFLRSILEPPAEAIRNQLGGLADWIRDRFNAVVDFFRGVPGRIRGAVSGMWDAIGDNFKTVINRIIGWWNNLSFSIDIPDSIPGLPSSFSINTPNIPMMAQGAYVTAPTLAVVGEGGEPEIVSPESKMREIVANYSSNIDYGRMAAAIAQSLAQVLTRLGLTGISREDLERLIAAAGVNVDIDARGDGATELAQALGFELRVLGFGGK